MAQTKPLNGHDGTVPAGLREKAASLAFKAGRYQESLKLSCECLEADPDNKTQQLIFTLSATDISLTKFHRPLKNATLYCLRSSALEHQKLFQFWSSIIACDPTYSHLEELAKHESFEDFRDAIDWKKLQSALTDEFLLRGLKTMIITRLNYERAFTFLRHWMLESVMADNGAVRQKHLPFLSALADQCFYNEYAYLLTPEEDALIETIAKDPWADPVKTALLACYRPLYLYADTIPATPHTALKDIIKTQIEEPQEEQRLKQTIPALTPITDETTKAVQEMYEQNPYPRWRHIVLPLKTDETPKGRYLIAGCGTGRSVSQVPSTYPNVEVSALDISRSSIAYARRKAKENNVNVDFFHGDILDVGRLDGTFDMIECGGVLHHMKDPVAGWRALLSKLAPGGIMLIGLYSTLARQHITAGRNYVAEKGYSPSPEGIRAFRSDVFAMPDDHELKRLQKNRNFYTTSECRDLIFHIQETTYTIPEIRKIMDDLDLHFISFRTELAAIKQLYRLKYPDDPEMANLERWQALEEEVPAMFLGMYQFLCCRKGEEDMPCFGIENAKKIRAFQNQI